MNNLLLSLLAFAAIFSSVLVITSKNPVVAVIFLISVFLCSAELLLALGVGFVGLSYIILYVGAIIVLFLFVLMSINIKLTDILEAGSQYTKNIPLALSIGLLFSYELIKLLPFNIKNISILESFVGALKALNHLMLGTPHPLYTQSASLSNLFTIFTGAIDTKIHDILQIEILGIGLCTFGASVYTLCGVILLLSLSGPILLSKKYGEKFYPATSGEFGQLDNRGLNHFSFLITDGGNHIEGKSDEVLNRLSFSHRVGSLSSNLPSVRTYKTSAAPLILKNKKVLLGNTPLLNNEKKGDQPGERSQRSQTNKSGAPVLAPALAPKPVTAPSPALASRPALVQESPHRDSRYATANLSFFFKRARKITGNAIKQIYKDFLISLRVPISPNKFLNKFFLGFILFSILPSIVLRLRPIIESFNYLSNTDLELLMQVCVIILALALPILITILFQRIRMVSKIIKELLTRKRSLGITLPAIRKELLVFFVSDYNPNIAKSEGDNFSERAGLEEEFNKIVDDILALNSESSRFSDLNYSVITMFIFRAISVIIFSMLGILYSFHKLSNYWSEALLVSYAVCLVIYIITYFFKHIKNNGIYTATISNLNIKYSPLNIISVIFKIITSTPLFSILLHFGGFRILWSVIPTIISNPTLTNTDTDTDPEMQANPNPGLSQGRTSSITDGDKTSVAVLTEQKEESINSEHSLPASNSAGVSNTVPPIICPPARLSSSSQPMGGNGYGSSNRNTGNPLNRLRGDNATLPRITRPLVSSVYQGADPSLRGMREIIVPAAPNPNQSQNMRPISSLKQIWFLITGEEYKGVTQDTSNSSLTANTQNSPTSQSVYGPLTSSEYISNQPAYGTEECLPQLKNISQKFNFFQGISEIFTLEVQNRITRSDARLGILLLSQEANIQDIRNSFIPVRPFQNPTLDLWYMTLDKFVYLNGVFSYCSSTTEQFITIRSSNILELIYKLDKESNNNIQAKLGESKDSLIKKMVSQYNMDPALANSNERPRVLDTLIQEKHRKTVINLIWSMEKLNVWNKWREFENDQMFIIQEEESKTVQLPKRAAVWADGEHHLRHSLNSDSGVVSNVYPNFFYHHAGNFKNNPIYKKWN